jgi:polyhydroxybutyrate depolymerase
MLRITRRAVFSLLPLLLICNLAAAAEELTRQQWEVEGVTREALVYAPPAAKTTSSPVVFAFHGHGGNMKQAAMGFAYHKHWPEAIVVYMQGLNTPGTLTDTEGKKPGWQKTVGDQNDRDLKFFDAVLTTLKQDYKVDQKRIYATGHSNGGGFTYLLWAARGDVFAAVAPCAAAALIGDPPDDLPAALAPWVEKAKTTMKNLKPKPVLHMAGENDPLVRFDWQKRTIDGLRKLNGCDEGKPWGEHCTLYPSKTGTPVVTYIHSGRHELPRDVPLVIVKFFKQHAKP